MAKVAATAKSAGEQVPRKGKRTHGGGPEKGTPKKGRTDKFCTCWCKAVDGPFKTHNTIECRRFNKDGSQKDKLTKPFDSAKKTWKKPGSGNSLKKRLQKSKKHKKRARESSDSDSDDNLDTGSSSTGKLVDKRLKIDQPSGIHLESTDTRPIKATKLALDTIRANEITIENSKTGKVTAVVAILKVFGDNTIHGALIPGNCEISQINSQIRRKRL
jgi:hypothetical protein